MLLKIKSKYFFFKIIAQPFGLLYICNRLVYYLKKLSIMKSKILFVLCLLTGLLFINSGFDKFFHYMPVPKEMPEKAVKAGTAFMTIGWILPLVGFAEIIGGLLLIFKKTRALGAIVILPVLTGIVLSNISMAPSALPIAAIIIAIIVWIIVENWRKYLPMISE